MMHSITMTIDQRARWSAAAWVIAALCALLLFASARELQSKSQKDIRATPAANRDYGYIGNPGN